MNVTTTGPHHLNSTFGGIPPTIPSSPSSPGSYPAQLYPATITGKNVPYDTPGFVYTQRDRVSPAGMIRKERETAAGMVSKIPPETPAGIFETLNDWARTLDVYLPAITPFVGGSNVPAEGHCSADGVCTPPPPVPDGRKSVGEFVEYARRRGFDVTLSDDLYKRFMAGGASESLRDKVVLNCDPNHSDMKLQAEFEDLATHFFVHPKPAKSIKGDEMLAESPGTVCTSKSWGKGTNSPCVWADDVARKLAEPEYTKAADRAYEFILAAKSSKDHGLNAKVPKKQANMGNALFAEADKWLQQALKLKAGSTVRKAAEAFQKQITHAYNTAQTVKKQREETQARLILERAQEGITVFATFGNEHCPFAEAKIKEAGKSYLIVKPSPLRKG